MTAASGGRVRRAHALTRPARTASVSDVSQSANLVARLHVDLRRLASALCAACR
ncbi:putative leader peptide [Streptomyces solincola]|uniref:putative leader peptide n=1 Tax=Streptomyces solincola TaxID=2100817 RepID=UPI002AFE839C|nr:putative leader peptide [Streptomyces solincola]